VERLVRFVVVLANERDADEAEDDAFLEELLWALLPLSEAADKAVRFRVCQLTASLLHGLSNDTGLADELYAELVTAMTERLRDRAPAARMQAARALARLQVRRTLRNAQTLARCTAAPGAGICARASAARSPSLARVSQDPGEAGDFADDAATGALLSLLECDKHKDVRRAVVASVGVSVVTIPALVERTRDNADEVRRTAFLTVANKVSLEALSIAQRATLLRRGLAERVDDVRKAALVMLGKFLKGAGAASRGQNAQAAPDCVYRAACRDDVVTLLGALDVETHEVRPAPRLHVALCLTPLCRCTVGCRDAAQRAHQRRRHQAGRRGERRRRQRCVCCATCAKPSKQSSRRHLCAGLRRGEEAGLLSPGADSASPCVRGVLTRSARVQSLRCTGVSSARRSATTPRRWAAAQLLAGALCCLHIRAFMRAC
jgi:hypothetical protein